MNIEQRVYLEEDEQYLYQGDAPLTEDQELRNYLITEITAVENFSQEKLIKELAGGRELSVPYAHYEPLVDIPEISDPCVVLSISGHPTDLWDFEGGTVALLENNPFVTVTELMVTRGEKGAPPLSKRRTIRDRKEETNMLTQILGYKGEYLQDAYGTYFSDGELLQDLTRMKDSIKEQLRICNPDILFLHSPVLDHLDHVSTYYATVRALYELSREKGKDFHKPAVYIRDPEFAFASAKKTEFEKLDSALCEWTGGRRKKFSAKTFSFKPETVSADYIVDITSVKEKKISAMAELKTQMLKKKTKKRGEYIRDLKDYVKRIPARSLLRGKMVGIEKVQWGEGFQQLHISGVTSKENLLAGYLPQGVMFKKK